jgi:CheY-like chemotaxis protein/anti-sigma regulatory factor (Ser/Thr protein kinase)
MVNQILAFSRQTEHKMSLIKLGPLVKEVLKLLRASLPTTIEIGSKISSQLGMVLADPTQIHQVLMNLCTNAAHAMEEKGGRLEVILTEVKIESGLSAPDHDLKSGQYIKLSVKDTGHGMDRKIMERIFDPFFTTKTAGKGTGMGLAVVHGIIKSHGGSITASSEPGKGSTFNAFLPVIDEVVVNKIKTVPDEMPTGNESILFVDDEEFVAELGREFLEPLGYKVTAETSSTEALEIFKADPDKFDLIITDQTMPKITGLVLSREILSIRPDVPIILCSGFSEAITKDKIEEIGIRKMVKKPYTNGELAKIIRKVLNKKS